MCFLFNQAPIEVTTSTREKKKSASNRDKERGRNNNRKNRAQPIGKKMKGRGREKKQSTTTMLGGSGDQRCRSSPWYLLLGSWRGLREKQGKNEEKITEKWRGEAEKDESKGGKKKKKGKRKVLWHGSVVGPLFLDFFGWNHNWVKCAKRVGLGNWSILSDEWWEKKKNKQPLII